VLRGAARPQGLVEEGPQCGVLGAGEEGEQGAAVLAEAGAEVGEREECDRVQWVGAFKGVGSPGKAGVEPECCQLLLGGRGPGATPLDQVGVDVGAVGDSAGDQPQRLLGSLKERNILEAAGDLPPLPSLGDRGSTHVVVEGEVLQGDEQDRLLLGSEFGDLLQDEEVGFGADRGLSGEVLQGLAELVEEEQHRGSFTDCGDSVGNVAGAAAGVGACEGLGDLKRSPAGPVSAGA